MRVFKVLQKSPHVKWLLGLLVLELLCHLLLRQLRAFCLDRSVRIDFAALSPLMLRLLVAFG